MGHYVLFERSAASYKDRLDKEKGIVKDVLILGLKSPTRKRRYSAEALKKAVTHYNNRFVNFDHPEKESQAGRPRNFTERFGKILNPHFVEGEGIRGDLNYNPHHEKANLFEWWVENHPDACALSHNAVGFGKMGKDGWTEIEEIEKVRSVDIVSEGGTTETLFEGALREKFEERSEMKKIFEVSETAMGLVRDALFDSDPEKTVKQRKAAVLEVVEEWSELLEEGSKKTTVQESKDMDLKDLSIETLKAERPDLVRIVLQESAQGDEQEKTRKRIELLENELDEKTVKLNLIERRELVEEKIKKSSLPETAITERFRVQLMEAKDEKAIDELIQDRIVLLESASGTKSQRGNNGNNGNNKPLSADDVVGAVRGR